MAKEKISYQEYLNREYNTVHAPYEPELDFYNHIAEGNLTAVKNTCEQALSDKEGLGKLSNNPIRNLKYHFIVSAAMISRTCINSGLPHSEAYRMSDYYINQVDELLSLAEISQLHTQMCLSYTKRMRSFSKEKIYSKQISKCVDYIYEHLDTKITINDLSKITGLSNSYISRLFKEETKKTCTDFILSKKIETAENMLKFSSYSVSDVSNALAFPSQSHFTKVFKDYTGTTPIRYKTGIITSKA